MDKTQGNMVVISTTLIGTKGILTEFGIYSRKSYLQINYSKTKVTVSTKRPNRHRWALDCKEIEQVRSFKCWVLSLLKCYHGKLI